MVGRAAAGARVRARERLRRRLVGRRRPDRDSCHRRRRRGRHPHRGGRGLLPRPALPAGARHQHAPGAALRAGQLAGRRRRSQLPPLLRRQHPRRRARGGPRGLRRHPRRDPALVRRGPRRRPARRPPGRPARPQALPQRPRRPHRRRLRPGREDPGAGRGAADVVGHGRHDRIRHARAARPGPHRPRWRGAAHPPRGPPPRRVRRLGADGPRQQAGGRRRHPPLRGQAHHPRGPADRRGGGGGAGGGRRRRAARVLPGLPLLPARGSPPRRRGPGRGPRAPARPGRDPRPARARPQRRVGPARPALPADVRDGDGQGCGGLLVLPLVAAHLPQRGRCRPVGLRGRRRDLPRRDGAASARVAARDDDHLDPRHQARRGRTRPHHGAGRAARDVGGRARGPARRGARAGPRLRLPALAGDPGCLDPRAPARPARAAARLRREGDARGGGPHHVDRARRGVRSGRARRRRRDLHLGRRAARAVRPVRPRR